MNIFLKVVILCFCVNFLSAQIGINTNTPDPSAALDIVSTDRGLLLPRVADTSAISSPALGVLIFSVDTNQFYFYNGSKWQLLTDAIQSTISDKDSDTKIQVEKIADDDIIRVDIKGEEKIIIISDSIGRTRLEMTNNQNNIAIGEYALRANIDGVDNTALGYVAMKHNTSGSYNVAIGERSLYENIDGRDNIALGVNALRNNISGERNIANGNRSLFLNTSGDNNTAHGFHTLYSNTTGYRNIATGSESLYSNTEGENNISIGYQSMYSNDTGNKNVAYGTYSLYSNAEGDNNVAIGYEAGYFETGSDKLYIENSDADSDNALIYGDFENDELRFNAKVGIRDYDFDATFSVKNISPFEDILRLKDNTGFVRAKVNNNGVLSATTFVATSDRRMKKNITPLENSLSRILAINGYHYNWNDDHDSSSLETGVMAQELLGIFPELVKGNEDQYGVNYDGLIPHMIESIKEQQKTIASLKSEVEGLQESVRMLLKK